MAENLEHLPPSDAEAEQAVLSACIISEEAFAVCRERLQAASFYHARHGTIWSAMCDVYDEESSQMEPLTLAAQLRRTGDLQDIGGEEYLIFLAAYVTTGANIEAHLRLVEEAATLRKLTRLGQDMTQQALMLGPSEEIVEQAEEALTTLSAQRRPGGFRPLQEAMVEAVDRVAAMEGTGKLAGLSTGFEDLDRLTGGFEAGDYILLAGRPSEGKTALGLQLARNIADRSGKKAAVVSAEMSCQSIALRLLASDAKVPVHALRMGHVEWPAIIKAMGRMDDLGFLVDDTPNLSIEQVRLRLRQANKQHDLGVILIDYLQLLAAPRAATREQEISQISRGMKSIAKEMEAPVIAISQLSRGIEHRSDRRPRLSDLRESGSLEQDADLVFFIYHNKDEDKQGLVDLICAKQRNGPTASIPLAWQEKWATFEQAAPEYREEQAAWWVDL